MKQKQIFVKTILLILTISLVFSCNKDRVIESEISTANLYKSNCGITFATFEGFYIKKTGYFEKKINIPTGLKLIDGQEVTLIPKVVDIKEVSINNKTIILEILKHKKNDKSDLCGFPTHVVNQKGELSEILRNYSTRTIDTIYVVTIHDEDYPIIEVERLAYTEKVKNTLSKCSEILSLDCFNKISSSLITKSMKKPNTIGGGVIPPK